MKLAQRILKMLALWFIFTAGVWATSKVFFAWDMLPASILVAAFLLSERK